MELNSTLHTVQVTTMIFYETFIHQVPSTWPTLRPLRHSWRHQEQHLLFGSTMFGSIRLQYILFSVNYILFITGLPMLGQVTGYLAETANVSHTQLSNHFTLRFCSFFSKKVIRVFFSADKGLLSSKQCSIRTITFGKAKLWHTFEA